MSNVDQVDQYKSAVHRRDLGRIVRFVLVIAIVVALVLVAMDNRDDVRIGYVFGDASAPVWIVLVASAIAGIFIGWLLRHRPHRDNV